MKVDLKGISSDNYENLEREFFNSSEVEVELDGNLYFVNIDADINYSLHNDDSVGLKSSRVTNVNVLFNEAWDEDGELVELSGDDIESIELEIKLILR